MRYVLENDLLNAEISDLGATLTRFIDKRSGRDIVLGYDTDEEYRINDGNLGAAVGRNANRIAGARFELDGKVYQLSENDHGNQLHGGGVNGFAFKDWTVEEHDPLHIVLSYVSADGEEGFPGELRAVVTYTLEDDSLVFAYEGTSDKDTLFNMTNHAYFNLGDEDIMNEYLKITSPLYSPTDENALTLADPLPVEGTPYDFRDFTRIGANLERLPDGIDNNYVWETFEEKLMAVLKNDVLQLSVYSDLPDMHLYTAYYLAGQQGKDGVIYKPYKGLCLECQYYPNGINYGDRYLLPVLRKGEKMKHHIRFTLEQAGKPAMSLDDLVKQRRSVRSYIQAEVKAQDIEAIIACAQAAPSWKNTQTGRYYVALSPESIKAVYDCLPSFNQNSSKNAAYIISTFKKDLSGFREGQPEDEYGNLWGAYDLGLQNCYLLFKAKELGYDTLIMGLRDEKALREYFGIPEDEILLPVIAIGRSDKQPSMNKRKPLTDILKIS